MRTRDWSLFSGLSLAWGTSFLFIKLAVGEVSPLLVGWLRLIIAALTLWGVAALAGLRPRFGRRSWLALAVMSLFNNSLAFTLIPWGEQYIDSGLAAIFNSTVPLFTVILAHFWLIEERLTVRRLTGLTAGFAGVVLLMAPQVAAAGPQWLTARNVQGSLAVVVASACYAVATVIGRRYLRREQPLLTAATQVTLGGPLAGAVGAMDREACCAVGVVGYRLGLSVLAWRCWHRAGLSVLLLAAAPCRCHTGGRGDLRPAHHRSWAGGRATERATYLGDGGRAGLDTQRLAGRQWVALATADYASPCQPLRAAAIQLLTRPSFDTLPG